MEVWHTMKKQAILKDICTQSKKLTSSYNAAAEKGFGRATWIHGFVQMLKSQQKIDMQKAKTLRKAVIVQIENIFSPLFVIILKILGKVKNVIIFKIIVICRKNWIMYCVRKNLDKSQLIYLALDMELLCVCRQFKT